MKKRKFVCDHIGIFTNNATRLVKFYTEKLGFKKGKKEILQKSIVETIFGVSCDCTFIKLMNTNLMIELFEPTSSSIRRRVNNTSGINHWGFCVGDKKNFVSQLKKKDVKIITIKRNAHVVYFIADPDGNRIEIRDQKKSKKNPPGKMYNECVERRR